MGDRTSIQGNPRSTYFDRLHDFMDVVTEAVVAKGLFAPMFHVFTETKLPCPSGETGIFPEFPAWPVEIDQVCFLLHRDSHWAQTGSNPFTIAPPIWEKKTVRSKSRITIGIGKRNKGPHGA